MLCLLDNLIIFNHKNSSYLNNANPYFFLYLDNLIKFMIKLE